MDVLYKKPFGDKCKHVHFDGESPLTANQFHMRQTLILLKYLDVHHGFAAARGKWDEGTVDRKRATEAIKLTVEYFNANL